MSENREPEGRRRNYVTGGEKEADQCSQNLQYNMEVIPRIH